MTPTALCATITASTMADLRRRRDAAVGADMVELRLDGVADLDVAGALDGRRRPVIVTCRPPWQGGHFDGDEATRIGILEAAWAAGGFPTTPWTIPPSNRSNIRACGKPSSSPKARR